MNDGELLSLIESLRTGDRSHLPELLAALKTRSPASVMATLQQHGLQVTGDGNIVGSGNVAIVIKDEFPALAMQLAELARQVRAADLYGQAAALLERGRFRETRAVLRELATLDAHYRGRIELLARLRRAQRRRRIAVGAIGTFGAVIVILIGLIIRPPPPPACDGKSDLPYQGVLALQSQRIDGAISWWVGRADDGLQRYVALSPVPPFYSGSDLGAGTVLALAIDQQQRIWVGTAGGGVTLIDGRSGNIIDHYNAAKDGLPGCTVSAILVAPNSRIYVGTFNGDGLGFSDDGKLWQKISPPKDVQEDKLILQVYSMASDSSNTVWVGTGRGLYFFDGKNWSQLYTPSWSAGRIVAVTAVGVDRKGVKWIGTQADGLTLLDNRPGKRGWSEPITERTGLASNEVTAIAILPGGDAALIGTTKGLSVCWWQEGAETVITCTVVHHRMLNAVPVHSVALAPGAHEAWIGTNNLQPVIVPSQDWLQGRQ